MSQKNRQKFLNLGFHDDSKQKFISKNIGKIFESWSLYDSKDNLTAKKCLITKIFAKNMPNIISKNCQIHHNQQEFCKKIDKNFSTLGSHDDSKHNFFSKKHE